MSVFEAILLTIITEKVTRIPLENRVQVEELESGFSRAVARYGFMEAPDVQEAIERWSADGVHLEPLEVSYFLSREKIVAGARERVGTRTADRIFAAMARNAGSVSDFFNIPANRVVELGSRVEM